MSICIYASLSLAIWQPDKPSTAFGSSHISPTQVSLFQPSPISLSGMTITATSSSTPKRPLCTTRPIDCPGLEDHFYQHFDGKRWKVISSSVDPALLQWINMQAMATEW